jgi:hypothetical protein
MSIKMSVITTNNDSNPLPFTPVHGWTEKYDINDKPNFSKYHFLCKLLQNTIINPITTTLNLSLRTIKLITWVPAKCALYKISGYHKESAEYLEQEYLKTVKVLRNLLFIPSVSVQAFNEMTKTQEDVVDDIDRMPTESYLKVPFNKAFQQFSSYLYDVKTFEVTIPENIKEFPATSDASLNTIMASHLFQPNMMAINFGSPNVATFVTEENEDGSVQTIKVDAKSLRRAEMSYHPTNGKIQSGVFLVPTNIPEEALNRFKKTAEEMQGRRDITCVNTNCRVLKAAGFSIDGVSMDKIIFPNDLMEYLLYKNVFYTDLQGNKHKVHFDIINTTNNDIEEYLEKVDTAVIGTRLRHNRRNADTEENQKARGAAAQAIIEQESENLADLELNTTINSTDLKTRQITVSVPSSLGNAIAHIWGRHTIYEVDLSDKAQDISQAFEKLSQENEGGGATKLSPFPEKNPSFTTRLKRDFFFCGPMIRFLRRHMMGHSDKINLHTKDLFRHLKSTEGERLNYVLLDDKVVLTRVNSNKNSDETHKKAADWALSKHAILSGRKKVYCSGEIWYDKNKNRFFMNDDSGTYKPTPERVKLTAELSNQIFDSQNFDNIFEAQPVTEKLTINPIETVEGLQMSNLLSIAQWLKSDHLQKHISTLSITSLQRKKTMKLLKKGQTLLEKVDSNTFLSTHEKLLMYSRVIDYMKNHKSIQDLPESESILKLKRFENNIETPDKLT